MEQEQPLLTRLDEELVRFELGLPGQQERLDLMVLRDFRAGSRLSLGKHLEERLRKLRKLPLPRSFSPSRHPVGGYHGITQKGSWTSLLRREFALPDFYFHYRLYNDKALYYERRRRREKPHTLLVIVLIDAGWIMQRLWPEIGYPYSLVKAFAACLMEDMTRYIATIPGTVLDFCVQQVTSTAQSTLLFSSCSPSNWPPCKEKESEEAKARPLLLENKDLFPHFFVIESELENISNVAVKDLPSKESVPSSGRFCHALERVRQRVTWELQAREEEGGYGHRYDVCCLILCSELSLLQQSPDVLEELSGAMDRGLKLGHSGALHIFALERPDTINYFVPAGGCDIQEVRLKGKEGYRQALGIAPKTQEDDQKMQDLRRQFLHSIVKEGWRARK